MYMKKLKALLILNQKKYISGLGILLIISILSNLLFKRTAFAIEGFIPMLVIFSFTVFKDYKSLK
jgi:hypothetical protein